MPTDNQPTDSPPTVESVSNALVFLPGPAPLPDITTSASKADSGIKPSAPPAAADALPAPVHPAPCNLQPSTAPPFTPAPGESARAFAAFCAYLELGPRRRYATAARQVGASLVSIKRWAILFDWRGRLNAHVARNAEQFVHQRDAELQGTVAREAAFRERQIVLAEALLDLAERYFERMDDLDLDHMRLPEVCRALEYASRLVGQNRKPDPAAAPDHGLRDQLTALLDQAFRETKTPVSP